MARTALIVKCNNRKKALEKALRNDKKPTHSTRVYNRCEKCGKIGSYMRRFGLCRICFRNLASDGMIMGVKKSSW